MDSAKPIYINLLIREQQQKRRIPASLMACLLLAVLGIGLGCWHGYMQDELRSLQAENAELQAELGQFKEEQLELQSYQDLRSQIESKEARVSELSQAKINCVEVYEEIEQAIPRGLVLIGIEINKEKVMMNGYAVDYEDLAAALSGLRKSPLLHNVMLLSSNIDKDSGEVLFKVEMRWEAGKE